MSETMTDSDSPQNTKELLNRLSRIEGQVQGLRNMVEDDAYCIDLIDQVNSVNQALKGLAGEVMENHLKGCVREAIESDDPYEEQDKIEEFMDSVSDFLKR
jgi:DNA-binding FrmR family transcriptional regulator